MLGDRPIRAMPVTSVRRAQRLTKDRAAHVVAGAPAQILATTDVHERLPQWPAVVQKPLQLKGFDAPVIAYELGRPEA